MRLTGLLISLAALAAPAALLAAGFARSADASFNAGIVWADYEGVYAADVDGSGVRQLVSIRIADEHYDPAWSPGGDAVVFSARISDGTEVYLLRPATRVRRMVFRGRWTSPRPRRFWRIFSYLLEPTWAPDGRHLALSDSWKVDASTIRIASLDTRRLRALTEPRQGQADSSPAWSPSGDTIAFVRRQALSTVPVILLVGPGGRGLHVLTRGDSPSWSPDGRRLVFAYGDAIYRIDADGRARTRLARGLAARGADLQPRWSPDGRKILYITRGGLWTMDVDGSDRTRVVRNRQVTGAGWRPA